MIIIESILLSSILIFGIALILIKFFSFKIQTDNKPNTPKILSSQPSTKERPPIQFSLQNKEDPEKERDNGLNFKEKINAKLQ